MSMIERVARAIVEAELGPGVPIWEEDYKAARAAIEAMREPDAKMRVAGIEAAYRVEKTGAPLRESIPAAFNAMIDTALSPTPEAET